MLQFMVQIAAITVKMQSNESLDKKLPSGGHCRMRMPHEQACVCFRCAMLPLRRFSCFCCSRLFITTCMSHKNSDHKHQLDPTNREQASSYQESYRQCLTPICLLFIATFHCNLGVFIPYDCSWERLSFLLLTRTV